MKTRSTTRVALLPMALSTALLAGGWSVSRSGEEGGGPGPASLFETSKVWDLELELTPEAHEALEPPGGPGRGPRPGGGPGFARRLEPRPDPSGMLAPLLLGDGDGDKDGDLDQGELLALGARWVETWDREKSGTLDEEEIAAGLDTASAKSPQGPGNFRPGARGFGMNLQGPEGKRNGVAAAMGIDFQYVRGTLTFDGKKLEEIGIRYKGNGTYLQSRGSSKISFKLDTNRFVKGQKLAGATKLNLHSNVTDPTWLNEVLSHELYRDAGVPAPRTSFARVHLTVPGKHEKRFLGLYTIVENVDGNFSAKAFGTRDGALFKPVTPDLFADLGDDWKAYNQTYDPKNEPDDAAKQRIIELSKLVTHAGDEDFARRIGEYIDIPELAAFMAVLACLADMDGILGPGQNFYIHLHPETRKLAFIPWDHDHSFGQFAMRGTQEQRENLSIERPWQSPNRFLERIYALEAFRGPYRAKLTELAETLFVPERIASRIDELARAIRPSVAEESAETLERFDRAIAGELPAGPGGPGGPGGFGFRGGPMRPARSFVKARHASLVEQLAGRSPGLVIGESGPGPIARRVDGDRPRGPGPERFGPGRFLARTLLGAMDADADRQVSRDEIDAGFQKWLASWDVDGNGALVADEVRSGLERTGQPGPDPAPGPRPDRVERVFDGIPFQNGPIRVGGPPGRGGGDERSLVSRFDADGNGRLDLAERKAARAEMRGGAGAFRIQGRRGGRPPVESTGSVQAPRLSPDGVPIRPGGNLFGRSIIRTYFLEFESPDWEQELEDFYRTDVRVSAKLTVDGKVYEGVGVNFRGSSSYMMSGTGLKRSLNLRIDHTVPEQRLRGRKRLNLLNSQGDPTFTRTIIYNHIASEYVPAPKTCHARVVINGESWGIYILQEEFDGDFLEDRFGTRKGVRWKVSGDGNGTFAYRGDNPDAYRRTFELKTKSGESSWPALIELCRLLDRAPAGGLEEALARRLAIDETLWFLALDNALMNCDGYWVPTGDFDLYLDEEGRFHPIPRDANEAFREPGGMIAGGAQVSGVGLDPLFGVDDPAKPLISRLLSVPELRARYVAHVRAIVEKWLDVEKLRPLIAELQGPIENDVWMDGRKLDGFEGFRAGSVPAPTPASGRPVPRRGGPARSLLDFVAARRAYLTSHPDLQAPAPRLLSAKTGEVLPGEPVRIVVEAAQGAPADRVILHHRSKSPGRFERLEMQREDDGRFAAAIPASPADTRVEYYIEARSKAHDTAAFFPPEAESKPQRYRVR